MEAHNLDVDLQMYNGAYWIVRFYNKYAVIKLFLSHSTPNADWTGMLIVRLSFTTSPSLNSEWIPALTCYYFTLAISILSIAEQGCSCLSLCFLSDTQWWTNQTGDREAEDMMWTQREQDRRTEREKQSVCVLTLGTPAESKWISQHTIDPDTVTPILYLSPSASCSQSLHLVLSCCQIQIHLMFFLLSLFLPPSLAQIVSHPLGAPGYNQITATEMEWIRNWHAVQCMCVIRLLTLT